MYLVLKKLVTVTINGLFNDFTSIYDNFASYYGRDDAIYRIYKIEPNKIYDIIPNNYDNNNLIFDGKFDNLLFFCSAKKDIEIIKKAFLDKKDTVCLKGLYYIIKNFRNGLIDIETVIKDEFEYISNDFISENDIIVNKDFLLQNHCSFNIYMIHKYENSNCYVQCRCVDVKIEGAEVFEKYNASFELIIDESITDKMDV
jgi:hypothetical protein